MKYFNRYVYKIFSKQIPIEILVMTVFMIAMERQAQEIILMILFYVSFRSGIAFTDFLNALDSVSEVNQEGNNDE